MMRLTVEGWRGISHSYAVVNQWQCLALLRRGDVALSVRDLPYCNPDWAPHSGLFPPEDEARLAALPVAGAGMPADAILRIAFPYALTPGKAPTWVFATSEFGNIPPSYHTGETAHLRTAEVRFITPSRWSRQGLLRAGIAAEKVTVVPHGIDPATFRPDPDAGAQWRRQLGLPDLVFLAVGAMTGNKGIDLLLRAFAVVTERHPQARLVLKGSEALYRSSHRLVSLFRSLPARQQRLLEGKVVILGQTLSMRALAGLYCAADAYVSPYLAEGFNMPVLEAAACGVPVVCTGGGPTDDFTDPSFALAVEARRQTVVYDGTEGEVLQPDLDHLIHCMMRVAEDAAWRREAGARASAFAHNRLSWDAVVARLLSVLAGSVAAEEDENLVPSGGAATVATTIRSEQRESP